MAPYSDNYVLQYVAKLVTGEYIEGLEKMKTGTEKTTALLNKSFGALGKEITKTIAKKLSMGAAALYLANKTRIAIQDMVAFQKQLSTFNTLLKGSREELNMFGDEFIRLSIKTGQAKEDIASGAYQALSSGIAKEDLIGFLETATKTAQAGLTTTENSIKTISSIMNAYKMSTKEAGEVADWLLTVQNKGVTTVDELGASLADVTSISSALEVSLNDVGAALAQMTQNGNNTAKSTTMLKTMLSELSKSGQQASDIFSTIAGQSFRSFIINGGNLQDALNMLDKYAKKSNKSISDLFSSVEAGNAALNLTGINADKFSEKLNDMKNKSGELNTSYKIATNNIKSEWDKLTQAMNSRWRDLVSWLEEPIYVTIREVRQVVDGEDNAIENLEDNKKRRAELEAKQQELLKKVKASPTIATEIDQIGKDIGKLNEEILRAENKIAEEAYNNNLNQYKKYRKDLEKYINGNHKGQEKEVKRHLEEVLNINNELLESDKVQNKGQLELDRQQIESKIDILNERLRIESDLLAKETELKQQRESRENKHKENLRKSELNYLENKRNYLDEQNNLLNLGAISVEEYQKNIEKKDRELLNAQKQANIESLKEMEDYYRQINDIAKANEYHKKIIEIEIEVKKNTSVSLGGDFNDLEDQYLENERIKRKEFQAGILQDEWEFLGQLHQAKLEGNLKDEDIEQIKTDRMLQLEQQKLQYEANELQNRLNFYEQDNRYAEQAANTRVEIQENKLKQQEVAFKREELALNKELKFANWAKKYEVDIYERSADTILSTYTMLAKGQIKSLEDFKNFALMQISELLIALGQEHAAIAVSDFAKGLSYAADLNPAIAAKAPPKFLSAKENAAKAAAFGVAAAMIGTQISDDKTENSKSSSFYDESINNQIDAAEKKENEGIVYIDVSNSALTKLLIKDIEKELKDGYNVTLVGKKKR